MKRWTTAILVCVAALAPAQARAQWYYVSPPPFCPIVPCPIGYWSVAVQPTVAYVPQWRAEPVVTDVPKLVWREEKVRTKVAVYVAKNYEEKRVVYAVKYEPKVVAGQVAYDTISEPRTVVVPVTKYEPEIREVDSSRWVSEWKIEKVVSYRYTYDLVATPAVKPVAVFAPAPVVVVPYCYGPYCYYGWW